MKKIYLSGEQIIQEYGITSKQILDGINIGKLTPFTSDGAKRIIDLKIHATLRRFSDETFNPEFREPGNCKPVSIDIENILKFIYRGDEVEKYVLEIEKELKTQHLPASEVDPPQKKKQRSRSSDLRDKAIIRAKEYIDQQKTKGSNPTLHKAAIIIDKEIVKGKFQVRTIKGWIRDYFSPESRLPGRIKKEERK